MEIDLWSKVYNYKGVQPKKKKRKQKEKSDETSYRIYRAKMQ